WRTFLEKPAKEPQERSELDESTLFITPRSPFARRVRVALIEHHISYQELALDHTKLHAGLVSVNSLHRVPTLLLKSGKSLPESQLILDYIYRLTSGPFHLKAQSYYFDFLKWTSLSLGMVESMARILIEIRRPDEMRDRTAMAAKSDAIERTLELIEKNI